MTVRGAVCLLILCSASHLNLARARPCWLWNSFSCDDGDCIDERGVCDGVFDCGDGSDERNCSATTTAWTQVPETTTSWTGPGSDSTAFIDRTKLEATPEYLAVKPGANVTLRCRSVGYSTFKLLWYKASGDGHLPADSTISDGRLNIPRIRCEDEGLYVCYPNVKLNYDFEYPKTKVEVLCRDSDNAIGSVDVPSHAEARADSPHTSPCQNLTNNGTCCQIVCKQCGNQPQAQISLRSSEYFRCTDGNYILNRLVCNKANDCSDGSDEFNCPAAASRTCGYNEFTCRDGSCISNSLYCDGEIDCHDGSDESTCPETWLPKIITLPSTSVGMFCPNPNSPAAAPSTLELECEFIGNPVPTVKWKKYEGHVARKCIQFTSRGRGLLRCPDFEQSDQGAYSCVAENSAGSSESQPKTIVKCVNEIECGDGFKVVDHDDIETCLNCFCSGKANACAVVKSEPVKHAFPLETDNTVKVFVRNGSVVVDDGSNANFGYRGLAYRAVNAEDLRSQSMLKAYGKNMNVPRYTGHSDYVPNAPDVVIRGNGLILKYSFDKMGFNSSTADVRFWPGHWQRNDGGKASRNDIMKVLSNVDLLLFRGEYEDDLLVSGSDEIVVESSRITEASEFVSYVEKCTCPEGYDGLSCEACATGYVREERDGGSDFACIPLPKRACPQGMTGSECDICDETIGYYRNSRGTCVQAMCSMSGSLGIFPDRNDNCICKENVVGEYCTECRAGSFNLDQSDPGGCKKCWCNDVSGQCSSLDWKKAVVSSSSFGGYNSSNGRNFWLLSELKGNLLTSYGGYLRYSVKHRPHAPAEPRPLAVEILSGENVLVKSKTELPADEGEKMHVVRVEEPFWRFEDDAIVGRRELLKVLSDVTAIYIESPYSLTSDEVSLGVVQLDAAEELGNSVLPSAHEEQVKKVEKCVCPEGYSGLSCETCAFGYYKRSGPNGFECVACDCPYCDPEFGCMQCKKGEYRDNPLTENPPICIECPCNGNELLCYKDSYEQVTCRCKPNYHGIYCEHAATTGASHLTLSLSPMRVRNKIAGTVTTFNCSYESTEELQIVFQKRIADSGDDSNSGDGRARVVGETRKQPSGAYSTADVNVDLELEYVECLAYDYKNAEVGRAVASVEGTVVDYVIPSIQNCYNEPKYVNENEDFDLICEASGTPQPEIRWYRREGESMTEMDTANGVHTIASPTMDANGTVYTCIATNILGDDKCSYPIFVRKKCEKIHVYPEALTVEEGDPVQIYCTTTSGAGVTWSRAETPWELASPNGSLAIAEALPSHGGKYVCRGRNESENKTVELVVNRRRAKPSVRILEADATLAAGDRFVVHCEVTGAENAIVTWRKDNGQLPFGTRVQEGGKILEIYPATSENAGLYECGIDGGSRSSSILVQVVVATPRVDVLPSSSNRVLEGSDLVLTCALLEPVPETKLSWWKLDGDFFDETALLASDDEVLRLKVKKSDAGRYVCKAENKGGIAEKEAEVVVLSPPSARLQPGGIVSQFVDDRINVTCTAEGSPEPAIQWLRRKLVARSRFRESPSYIEETIRAANATITVEITADLHSIVCLAENEVGSDAAAVVFEKRIRSGLSSGESQQVELGTGTKLLFSGLAGGVKCRRRDRSLLGDECYLQNGLEISSVQIQHGGVYLCRSDESPWEEKSFALVVKGFATRFHQNRSSYLVLPLKTKSKSSAVVEVTFRAEREKGLILLGKMHHEFLLFLSDGRLSGRLLHNYWSPESEHVVLDAETRIRLHAWYTVVLHLEDGQLLLYDEDGYEIEAVSSPMRAVMRWKFRPSGKIYVGGTSSRERMLKLKTSRLAVPSFEGCVSRVVASGHEYKMSEEGEYSKDVSLCNVCSSATDPCRREGGICRDAPTRYGFVCVCDKEATSCPEGCRGEGCSSGHDLCELVKPCGGPENRCIADGNSLRCECSDENAGITCDKEPEFCSSGHGFVRLPSSYLERRSLSEPEVISMKFTPHLLTSDGLLLRQGDDSNYLVIALKYNVVEYTYMNQGRELTVRQPLSAKTAKHSLIVTRHNNTVTMDVDGVVETATTDFTTHRVWGDIYLGGEPDRERNPYLVSHPGFRGCIKQVAFGKSDTPVDLTEPGITRHNVSLQRFDN